MLHVNCIKRTLVILGLRGTVWNMTLICSGWFTPEYSPTYPTLALPSPPFLVRMMGFHNDSSILFSSIKPSKFRFFRHFPQSHCQKDQSFRFNLFKGRIQIPIIFFSEGGQKGIGLLKN